MKNFFIQAGKVLLSLLIGVLTYVFMVIDRLCMVPFPMWTSYSASDLASMPERFTTLAFFRVLIVFVVIGVYYLIKWLFL